MKKIMNFIRKDWEITKKDINKINDEGINSIINSFPVKNTVNICISSIPAKGGGWTGGEIVEYFSQNPTLITCGTLICGAFTGYLVYGTLNYIQNRDLELAKKRTLLNASLGSPAQINYFLTKGPIQDDMLKNGNSIPESVFIPDIFLTPIMGLLMSYLTNGHRPRRVLELEKRITNKILH